MKRTFATAALVVALIVQVAHAAPAQALASLRAMTCCARGCDHHARSLSDAMRCCGVRAGDDLAVTPLATTKLVPTFVAHALGAPAISGDALVASSMQETPRHDRPPPVFLLVRSLRL